MLDFLYSIDLKLFIFFNQVMTNSFFDIVMPFVTHLKNWYPVIGILMIIIVIKDKKLGLLFLLIVALAIATSDQISSSLLKPTIGRLRPCIALENVRLLVSKKSSFSFPSSHATNMAALAALFAIIYPALRYYVTGLALIIGYSRVYIGVHYPFDVLTGFILGTLIGICYVQLYFWSKDKFFKIKKENTHA